MSDRGIYFISGKFITFCKKAEYRASGILMILPQEEWAGRVMHQVHTVHNEKCMEENNDINLGTVKIKLPSVGPELPSPVLLPFNRTVWGMMPRVCRTTMNFEQDKDNHNTLQKCHGKITKNNDIFKESSIISVGSTVPVQHQMVDLGPMYKNNER